MEWLTALLGPDACQGLTSLWQLVFTDADPHANPVFVPLVFEYLAVGCGAAAGSLIAVERRLDLVGLCTAGLLTGLGGGLVRDAALPTDSIYMLDNPSVVLFAIFMSLLVFFFSGLFYKLDKPIAVLDILSVALFTLTGADKALVLGYNWVACVLMGVITGVGGGMIRDVCMGQIPGIFKPGNFYATCSIAGGLAYVGLINLHMTKFAAGLICIIIVVGLRWLSLRYDLMTVEAVDHTPRLIHPLSRGKKDDADHEGDE